MSHLAGRRLPARRQAGLAVEEFDAALTLKPKKADLIQVRRARALFAAGRVAEAKALIEEILQKDPDQPEAKAARGEIK